jgi:hypothetical protein
MSNLLGLLLAMRGDLACTHMLLISTEQKQK